MIAVADPLLRPIRAQDDPAMAAIIRQVMTEMGASGPGFAIHDAEVDDMTRAYPGPRARYYVVERGGRVVGGGGFAPLDGGPDDTCELRKMYFLPEARGGGTGRRLLGLLLDEARAAGFRVCYLETLAGMAAARALYESVGFRPSCALGATGHFGCDTHYVKTLE
jgi:putative acetyltransferase